MRHLCYRQNCNTWQQIKAFLDSDEKTADVIYSGDEIHEYEKYHRYIREHRLKGVKVHKEGMKIWLERTEPENSM